MTSIDTVFSEEKTMVERQTHYRQPKAAYTIRGWSGGAMVLGKLPVPGRPTILIKVGQGLFRLQ